MAYRRVDIPWLSTNPCPSATAKSNCSRFNLRWVSQVAALNICQLITLVIEGTEVMAAKVRRPGRDMIIMDGYTYLFSWDDGHQLQLTSPSVIEVSGWWAYYGIGTEACFWIFVSHCFEHSYQCLQTRWETGVLWHCAGWLAVSCCCLAGFRKSVGPHGSAADLSSEDS